MPGAALIGVAATLAFVVWRIRRGSVRLVHLGSQPRRVQVSLFVAGVTGFTLNLCMFIAFDRITVALALLGFYTYPALVAIANVALGRERLDTPRVVALGLALLGMVAVVASQLDPNAGIRFDALGFGLALAAAVSQMVFVVISRDGYREVPTEQAMTTVLLVTVVGATALALLTGQAAALVLPVQDAVDPAAAPLHRDLRGSHPVAGFLAGIRVIGGTRAGILMLFEPVVGVAARGLAARRGAGAASSSSAPSASSRPRSSSSAGPRVSSGTRPRVSAAV